MTNLQNLDELNKMAGDAVKNLNRVALGISPNVTIGDSDKVKPKKGINTLPLESEDALQQKTIDLLHLHGYIVAHFLPARTGRKYIDKDGQEKEVWTTPVQADGKGFPDLVAVKPPRIIFIECKSEKGKLSKEQEIWMRLIILSKSRYFILKPSSFDIFQRWIENES